MGSMVWSGVGYDGVCVLMVQWYISGESWLKNAIWTTPMKYVLIMTYQDDFKNGKLKEYMKLIIV